MVRLKTTPRLVSCNYHTKMNIYPPTEVTVITPALSTLLDTPWMKCHLYNLGADLLRLKSYRKFNHLLFFGGAGVIKAVVHDITTFIRKEVSNKSEVALQIRDLLFLTSNSSLPEQELTSCWSKIGINKLLYIIPGYLQLLDKEFDFDLFLDKVIDIYMNKRNLTICSGPSLTCQDSHILSLFLDYVENVVINDQILFGTGERYINLTQTKGNKIVLPSLPKIHNKKLLVKALMHKESYRALLKPEHSLAKELTVLGFDLDHKNYNVLRYELSFLDGLGDFFLAHESSKLLYDVYGAGGIMHTHIYNLLKVILATNTLLCKLTVEYNLHRGLKDSILNETIHSEYVPNVLFGLPHPTMTENETRVYEEEFLGDYFESYVGALFLEQPAVATKFVGEIYHSVLNLITKTLPPDVSYDIWTTSIIGRSLALKKKRKMSRS